MFKYLLIITILSQNTGIGTISNPNLVAIQQELNNFDTKLLNNYQSYQEAYDKINNLYREYQNIQVQLSTQFSQTQQFEEINTEINAIFAKILNILIEINSRNKTKIELIETNLQAKGYQNDKIDNLNLYPLTNGTQKFLLSQEITKLSSILEGLINHLDGLTLTTQQLNTQENEIDSNSKILNLLAILLLVISILLLIFVINNILNKNKESRLNRLERKVNKTLDSIKYINQQLESQELTLKKVVQDIKYFVNEANNYLDKFDQNLEDRYLNKKAYEQEISRLETLISDLKQIQNNSLNPLVIEGTEISNELQEIYLAQYLAIYNQNPNLLWQCSGLIFYEVREAQESENLRLKTSQKQIILEQPLTGAGIFWLIKFPEITELYLFPKELEISEAKSDTIIALFDGYKKSNSNYFHLIKPAIVSQISEKTWCLLVKGEIESSELGVRC